MLPVFTHQGAGLFLLDLQSWVGSEPLGKALRKNPLVLAGIRTRAIRLAVRLRAVVVYSLEYWPVVHDVAGSIPANHMDGE